MREVEDFRGMKEISGVSYGERGFDYKKDNEFNRRGVRAWMDLVGES